MRGPESLQPSDVLLASVSTIAVFATKAGLHSFTQAIRHQLENSSVRVIELIPPLVDTAMTKGRGEGKISPERVAREALQGLAKDKSEIHIGMARTLYWLNRCVPGLVMRLLRDS